MNLVFVVVALSISSLFFITSIETAAAVVVVAIFILRTCTHSLTRNRRGESPIGNI